MPKKMYKSGVEGRKGRIRPSKDWGGGGVKEVLSGRGLGIQQACVSALDRCRDK